MFLEHIATFRDLVTKYNTDEACIAFLEEKRWKGTVVSPFDKTSKVYVFKNGKYFCKNTRKYFTVRTRSIFEKTRLPLPVWFQAIWYITSWKRGISSIQLANELGLTQKTAWHIAHKIRTAFKDKTLEEMLSGIFEIDEAVYGGKQKNRHKDKKIPNSKGGLGDDKTWVLGILQRNGIMITIPMPGRNGEFAQHVIRRLIAPGSIIMTDAWKGYNGLSDIYHHFVVKNGQRTQLINPEAHTNGVEGAWANTKRGYIGTYNWWSKKYLPKYLDEFIYRRNTRKLKSPQRFSLLLENVFERVTYEDIRNAA